MATTSQTTKKRKIDRMPPRRTARRQRHIRKRKVRTYSERRRRNWEGRAQMNTTIHGLQRHFRRMYAKRNSLVNGSFEARACHMTYRIGKIVDSWRKKERMPGRLARAVSYFFNLINFFDGAVDLERGMMLKFPPFGCAYCTHMPCDCNDKTRPNPENKILHKGQRRWTLRQWQRHLFRVYGHRNIGKFEKAFMRLVSEYGELCILNVHGPHTPNLPNDALREFELEAADVFSWILTLAYIKGINLERAVVERYNFGCPGCDEPSCNCQLVFGSKDGSQISTVGIPGTFEASIPVV